VTASKLLKLELYGFHARGRPVPDFLLNMVHSQPLHEDVQFLRIANSVAVYAVSALGWVVSVEVPGMMIPWASLDAWFEERILASIASRVG
jgi:hypothetical protein